MSNTLKVSTSQFKNVCFIGLNKVTFYTESGEVLTGDNWLELTDEQSRRNMALAFFAPRDLNGEPMDPNTVLFPEDEDISTIQNLKNISLFDLCRAEKAAPNRVNIVLVADIIFHWDSQDNYIQPTADDTWQDDLKSVLAGYPRTTEKHIYTDWPLSGSNLGDGVHTRPLKDLPLDTKMWINQPTFQEKYGTHALIAGIVLSFLTYFGLSYQTSITEAVNKRTRQLQTSAHLYPNYNALESKVKIIEEYNNYSALFPIVFKDISLAITDNNLTPNSFSLEVPNPRSPSDILLMRVRLPSEVAPTFAQQEPLAQELLSSSLTVTKIRKPNVPEGSPSFELEGLIPLARVAQLYKEHKTEEGNNLPLIGVNK